MIVFKCADSRKNGNKCSLNEDGFQIKNDKQKTPTCTTSLLRYWKEKTSGGFKKVYVYDHSIHNYGLELSEILINFKMK